MPKIKIENAIPGHEIAKCRISPDEVLITFTDGAHLVIKPNIGSGCEFPYLTAEYTAHEMLNEYFYVRYDAITGERKGILGKE